MLARKDICLASILSFSLFLAGCSGQNIPSQVIDSTKLVDSPIPDRSTLSYKFFMNSGRNSLPSTYTVENPKINSLVVPFFLDTKDYNFDFTDEELNASLVNTQELFKRKTKGHMEVNFVVSDKVQASDSLNDSIQESSLNNNDNYFNDFFYSVGQQISDEILSNIDKDSFDKLDSNDDGYIDSLIIVANQRREYVPDSRIFQILRSYTIKYYGSGITKGINEFAWINGYDLIKRIVFKEVIVHEMGHFMGLPDLYDLSDLTEPFGMHEASSIMTGYGLAGFSPFERYLLGWDLPKADLSPTDFTFKNAVEIDLNIDADEYVILRNEGSSSPFSQYLILRPGRSPQELQRPYLYSYHADARIESTQINGNIRDRFNVDLNNNSKENPLTFAFSNTPGSIHDPYMKHPLIYMLSKTPNQRLDTLNKSYPAGFDVGDGLNIVSDERYMFYGTEAYDTVEFRLGFRVLSITDSNIRIQVFKRSGQSG